MPERHAMPSHPDARNGNKYAPLHDICTRGVYDNMKTAAETVFIGKERV